MNILSNIRYRNRPITVRKNLFPNRSFSHMAAIFVYGRACPYNWRSSNWFASYRIWDENVARMTWLEQWPSQACKHGELYRCSVDRKVCKAWLDRARKKGFTHYPSDFSLNLLNTTVNNRTMGECFSRTAIF